jgi:hypothetical protein
MQTHSTNYPVLAHIARDVLAIPGVSISVERLFSSSKHTLSDTLSSLSAVSASKTVVVKEWLRKGSGKMLIILMVLVFSHKVTIIQFI